MDVERNELGPETFDAVVESVRSWASLDDLPDGDPIRELRKHIETDLNADAETDWEHDVVELGHQSSECEIIVNGTIGVRFVNNFNPGSMQRFDRELRAKSDRYEYLLIYLHELPAQFQDGWRVRQRKFTAARLGLRGCKFVVRHDGAQSPGVQVNAETVREIVKTIGFLRMVALVTVVSAFVVAAVTYGQLLLVLILLGAVLLWLIAVWLYLRYSSGG